MSKYLLLAILIEEMYNKKIKNVKKNEKQKIK